MSPPRPWVLLCKPVRAPFRDGTSVLVRNMLQSLPPDVELIYFGDPAVPVRKRGDTVMEAGAMSYQPSLTDKVKMLARIAAPKMSRLPIHSFFAANRASARALDVLRRFPRKRAVMQTLPASTGAGSVAPLLAKLDRVVVTSDWGRDKLIAAGVPEARVVRVYPGIALVEDTPGPPLEERRTLLFAGDLDQDVGERLIAIARILEPLEEWRLEIATRPKGDGHRRVRDRLAEVLAPAIDAGQVALLGEVPSMDDLFDRCALQLYLAAHAKRKVDIPFVLLEGMARGVPVAVVDGQPVGELLTLGRRQDREIGLALDPTRFGESIEDLPPLLRDAARMRRLGRAARQLISDRFSATEMAQSYRRHYEELS